MNALHELGTFEVKIGGIVFRMYRRTTALMLLIGDPVKVFGLLAEGRKKEGSDKEKEASMSAYFKSLSMMED